MAAYSFVKKPVHNDGELDIAEWTDGGLDRQAEQARDNIDAMERELFNLQRALDVEREVAQMIDRERDYRDRLAVEQAGLDPDKPESWQRVFPVYVEERWVSHTDW